MFVCLLLTPAGVWLINLDFGIQVKRIGLQPPPINGHMLLDNQYYLAFDQYFNDSFSLRSPLIFAKRWLDFRVFHMTDTPGVHVGTDRWLFSRHSIEDYQKEACSQKADVANMVLRLHALEKIIEASGRRFLFIVAPNKSTVYPEFLGFVPQRDTCNRSRYDLLLETIGLHPLYSFVRLDELLNEAKKSHALLYDPTSIHWNGLGAIVAGDAIRQQIVEGSWSERRLDYRPLAAGGPGNLKQQLLGIIPLAEEEPVRQYLGSGRPVLSPGIIYGDDFLLNLLPYLQQLFNQLNVIQTDRVPSGRYGEDLRDYEFILIEKAESELGSLHIDTDKIYSVFESEAEISLRYALDLNTAVALSKITLDIRPDGLKIKSVGTSSIFKLISVPASRDDIFRVLKLSIDSPHSDIMTVRNMSDVPYIAQKPLKAGLTEVYLPLPFEELSSLRIQPGNQPGVFILRSAEILEFAGKPDDEAPLPKKIVIAQSDMENELASHTKLDVDVAKFEPLPVVAVADRDMVVKDNPPEQVTPENTESEAINESSNLVAQQTNRRADQRAEVLSDHARSETGPHNSVPISQGQDFGSNSSLVESGNAGASSANEFPAELTPSPNISEYMPQNSAEADSMQKTQTENATSTAIDVKQKTGIVEVARKNADVPISKALSVTVTDFENGRIFQRKGRSADIVVSGAYAGKPEAIEARVVKDSTLEEIVSWTVIDASPQNGIFVGTLMDVPQGGWYNIQVRSSVDHSVSDSGTHKWGVGILTACLGQSNMKEWFFTGTDLAAHPLLRKFSNKGWSTPGMQGNAAIAFGNRIIERLGIPVGLLDYSKNGSGLRKEADWGTGYWEDRAPGSIYNRFLAGVSKAGGALEFVIWIQGEADAARGTVTEEEYRNSLESFITHQVRANVDNGSEQEHLPFLVVLMVKRPGGKDKPHQWIRNAQKRVAEDIANCYLAATTLDLKNKGRQHLAANAYTIMGRRVAQTVLYILKQEAYHRGPMIADVKRLDDRTLELKLQHRGGTDFKPASGISGWEVLKNHKSVPIADVYRHDPKTIRIRLKRPLSGRGTIRYLYGAMPNATKAVIDNSAMSLPLEEFQAEID